jgi:hypothetical protein
MVSDATLLPVTMWSRFDKRKNKWMVKELQEKYPLPPHIVWVIGFNGYPAIRLRDVSSRGRKMPANARMTTESNHWHAAHVRGVGDTFEVVISNPTAYKYEVYKNIPEEDLPAFMYAQVLFNVNC